MAFGAGKYDHICTVARESTQATAVVVIILEGNKGSGFSVQADAGVNSAVLTDLTAMLRVIANQIEMDANGGDT